MSPMRVCVEGAGRLLCTRVGSGAWYKLRCIAPCEGRASVVKERVKVRARPVG